jgi:DNA-binding NtrC family response regulator
MRPRILLIEDDPATRFGFVKYLSKSGFDISEAENLSQAGKAFSLQQFDAVIIDMKLPDGNGIDFIDKVRESSSDIPLIVITGAGDIPLAVDAMRRGADNFLSKPVDMEGLEVFLKKSLEIGAIKKINTFRIRLEKKEEVIFEESPAMQEVFALARIAAESDSQVLLTGETGTGKGVIAKWIHRQSRRSSFPFVDINCSALKGDLLARELFGNVRGAYTSANQDRDGLLDAADGGTLFLDEIGEMDISVQAQLLKVIEEKTYRRLGDTKLQRSDFRLVCATNKNIEEEIRNGAFRRDLYFRVNLLTIHVPPLRERTEDLEEIVNHIIGTSKTPKMKITEDAVRMLKMYPWPGNIRELRNVLERAMILSRGELLTPEHFAWMKIEDLPETICKTKSLEEVEHNSILSVLKSCGGKIEKASKILGISRATLYRRLKEIKEKTDADRINSRNIS